MRESERGETGEVSHGQMVKGFQCLRNCDDFRGKYLKDFKQRIIHNHTHSSLLLHIEVHIPGITSVSSCHNVLILKIS